LALHLDDSRIKILLHGREWENVEYALSVADCVNEMLSVAQHDTLAADHDVCGRNVTRYMATKVVKYLAH
jgi:hypothetical protein